MGPDASSNEMNYGLLPGEVRSGSAHHFADADLLGPALDGERRETQKPKAGDNNSQAGESAEDIARSPLLSVEGIEIIIDMVEMICRFSLLPLVTDQIRVENSIPDSCRKPRGYGNRLDLRRSGPAS